MRGQPWLPGLEASSPALERNCQFGSQVSACAAAGRGVFCLEEQVTKTAGHVKMLTLSAAGAFSKEITRGCKQCSPASLLAFLYFFYTFLRYYCFTLIQIPLLLVPQMTPCTHNPSLLPLAPPLPQSLSGATQVHGCLLGQKWPHTE